MGLGAIVFAPVVNYYLRSAAQIDVLRDACVEAAVASMEVGDAAWAGQFHALGSALNIASLTEQAFARLAREAISKESYLEPLMEALERSSTDPAGQLACIFEGLGRSYCKSSTNARWPTSIVVVLLLRMDQLTKGKRTSSEQQQEEARCASSAPVAGLDVAALLEEVDFNQILQAECRALSVMATNCSKETPALVLLMRRLLQRGFGSPPARLAAECTYGPAVPGTFVAGTLDLASAYFSNPRNDKKALFLDRLPEENKLFGCEEGATQPASLSVQYKGVSLRMHSACCGPFPV